MDQSEYQKLIQSSIEFLKSALENKVSTENSTPEDTETVSPITNILSICKDIAKLKECAPVSKKEKPSENGHIKLVPLANLMKPEKHRNKAALSVQTIVLDSEDDSDSDKTNISISPNSKRSTVKSKSTEKTSKKTDGKKLDNGDSSSSSKTVKHRDKKQDAKQTPSTSISLRSTSSVSDKSDDETERSPNIRAKRSIDDESNSSAVAVDDKNDEKIPRSSEIRSKKSIDAVDVDELTDDKQLSEDEGSTSAIAIDTATDKKRVSVKIKKLSNTMSTIMKKYRLKQIVDDNQKVIAQAAEDEDEDTENVVLVNIQVTSPQK